MPDTSIRNEFQVRGGLNNDDYDQDNQASPGRVKGLLCKNGIRFRDHKYVVEVRLKRFKKKVSLGTYGTEVNALIARDVCTFHTEKQPTPQAYNFKISPKVFVFAGLPPLTKEFKSLDTECKDDGHLVFSSALRERTTFWIKQNADYQWVKWSTCISDEIQDASTGLTGDENFDLKLPVLSNQNWESMESLQHIHPLLNIHPQLIPAIDDYIQEEPSRADAQDPMDSQHNTTSDSEIISCGLVIDPESGDSLFPCSMLYTPSEHKGTQPSMDYDLTLTEVDVNDRHRFKINYSENLCTVDPGDKCSTLIVACGESMRQPLESAELREGKDLPPLQEVSAYQKPCNDTTCKSNESTLVEELPSDWCQGDFAASNLPSHIYRYNCIDLIPGIALETGALLLSNKHVVISASPEVPFVSAPTITTTYDELLARRGGVAGFELMFQDDMTHHGGPKSPHIWNTLDSPPECRGRGK